MGPRREGASAFSSASRNIACRIAGEDTAATHFPALVGRRVPLELGVSPAPRVAWSYWDKGFERLSAFRRLCVQTWVARNPSWHVYVLDRESVFDFLAPRELPKLWKEMYVPWQADAVRLALLAKYGGMWVDASTICLQPFDSWMYDIVASEQRPEDLGAFYFASWGVDMHHSKEYVENWVMAAKRDHPMILAWQAIFNGYWNSKTRADELAIFLDPPGVPEHALFRGVDLGHLKRFGMDLRNYLLMHAAFKKLIDQYPEMRRIWQEEMVLVRADDTAFWHMEEPDVQWNVEAALRKWLGPRDNAWLGYVLRSCPVLKFTRDAANALDGVPPEDFLDASTCMGGLFRAALEVCGPPD